MGKDKDFSVFIKSGHELKRKNKTHGKIRHTTVFKSDTLMQANTDSVWQIATDKFTNTQTITVYLTSVSLKYRKFLLSFFI